MTRQELIKALRLAGYDGPVSYAKPKLEELLKKQRSTPAQTTETDDEFDGGVVKTDTWCGLVGPRKTPDGDRTDGTIVKVVGQDRKKFEFMHYFRSPAQEYVCVMLIGRGTSRFFAPDQILDAKTKKPVLVGKV